jgi:outer membrane protein assembly factor BamB
MKKLSIFILCAVIALSYSCSKEQVDEYAMIAFMIGDVKKNNQAVEIGDIIHEKDVIITAEDAFCDVKIGGSIIRVKEKSKVIVSNLLRSNNLESTELGLNVGKMLCKPKKLLKSESFVVKTPTAVAGVRGTKFTIEADVKKTTRIKVFDGKVKVAKRIKQLESSTEKVLEIAPVVGKEKKVIITEAEVKKDEKRAEKLIKEGGAKEMAVVITKLKNDFVVSRASIKGFKVADFAKENREIIAIQPKTKAVIKQIIKVIEQEKEIPKPDGRLLVTRYEVYFIKNGKVLWEGTVVENPIKKNGKIYIASGDYVFCASDDGPVLWRKKINNDGKLRIEENALSVFSKGQVTKFDLETGEKM